jgi:hypothetical protein
LVLAVALFKVEFWVNIFSASSFSSSRLFVGGGFFVGVSPGWFCRVAEIGFKVFGLRFGLRWF